ncbi:heavy metal sensor histidine kinase [Erwinia sp. INIA-01]|uniref:heavy metal sensor histidine kinase n=1 Tax=Erwinia sp. INIA01 TaxID=2991500 RepID=UPI00222505F2|nr:heavy metal sensor histidine kinase [Erwinia sp. INIA01]MCW1874414.1 heavy metal sensor histidine kinase [Erwinia sp. INIA01]
MYSPSLTLRLTAIFTLIVALACGGISLILYSALRSELVWRDDQTLINRAAQLRQLLEGGAHPDSLPLYFNRMVDTRQDILSIGSQHQQNVSINHTGVALPEMSPTPVSTPPGEQQIHRWIGADNIEASALSLQARSEEGPIVITLARVARERAIMLERYRQQSILVSLAAILLCAALSPLLIRRGLRAIGRLSQAMAETGSDRLTHTVPLQAMPKELLPLGEALNTMRQRLSTDFIRLTQFADDLAHEIRTPINVLLGQNQVALGHARSTEEYQALLEGNIEELEALSRLTENILFLARATHHNIRLNKETFLLHDALETLIDFLEPVAEEREMVIELHANGHLTADKMLFQRAMTNLLVNAIRYAPGHGAIAVSTLHRGDVTEIEVANAGDALAEPEKVFERFWRGDNVRHTAGSGLGLSLVSAIAALHGGSAYYRHEDGGNIFGVRLVSCSSRVDTSTASSAKTRAATL